MFGLFRAWRRRKLARKPFPTPWLAILEQQVPFYLRLSPDLQQRLRALLKLFVWEKHWVGAGGQEITAEVQVVIAACAARLVLHRDLAEFDQLSEIVVYPSAYKHADRDGAILGEAHLWGTVVLAWSSVQNGLRNPDDGHDTATHEFAHVIDRNDGEFDGTPILERFREYGPWAQVMSGHFLRLQQGRRDLRKVMRDYGATNEAEFFAVATESFFEKPAQMLKRTPELYTLLQSFYGGDPAAEEER